MKCIIAALAAACWSSALAGALNAQPILDRVEQLLRNQIGAPRGEQGYLGLVVDEDENGLRVVRVVDRGPAAQQGIQAGDLITQIDGKSVRSMDDMAEVVRGKPVGTKITVAVNRGGQEKTFTPTLARRAAAGPRGAEELPGPSAAPGQAGESPPPRLGIQTEDVSPEAQRQNRLPDSKGAMIIAIVPGSPAERAGLPLGAIIRTVDGREIESPQALAAAVRAAEGREVELGYVDRGEDARKRITPAAGPQATVVARPPTLPLPTPAPARPATSETPSVEAADTSRVAALEARIRELEARIAKLEARLTGKDGDNRPAPDAQPSP